MQDANQVSWYTHPTNLPGHSKVYTVLNPRRRRIKLSNWRRLSLAELSVEYQRNPLRMDRLKNTYRLAGYSCCQPDCSPCIMRLTICRTNSQSNARLFKAVKTLHAQRSPSQCSGSAPVGNAILMSNNGGHKMSKKGSLYKADAFLIWAVGFGAVYCCQHVAVIAVTFLAFRLTKMMFLHSYERNHCSERRASSSVVYSCDLPVQQLTVYCCVKFHWLWMPVPGFTTTWASWIFGIRRYWLLTNSSR